jgi:hypothetical protein
LSPRAAALAAAVVALPLAFAIAGSRNLTAVSFNLGPGDAPYVAGFAPQYEIDDKVATHWTTYRARIDLPLAIDTDQVVVVSRFARVFPQTAVVQVSLAGEPIDRFECRGGVFQERRAYAGGRGPVGVVQGR